MLVVLMVLFFSVIIGMAFAEAPLHIDIYEHPFTTVKTDLGGGHVCIGYENAPAGATHIRLIWNEIGQNASSMNDYPVGYTYVPISDADASCLVNTSQNPWSSGTVLGSNSTATIFPPGYWWVQAFDDPSSYTVIGYEENVTGAAEGTSTQIFLENIPIPPPLMTNENVYVSISSGNTQTTQVEYESHFETPTIDNPYNNLDNPYNNLFNGVEYSNDDLKSELFQASQHMVELSTNLSNALEEVAQLKSQIQNMNGTSEEVLQMQTEIQTLKDDRDYWKDLAETWYAIAINQMRIMVDVLGL